MSDLIREFHMDLFSLYVLFSRTFLWDTIDGLRACLPGGGGDQVDEVTRLVGVPRLSIKCLIWSPHLSCTRDQINMRDCIDRQVTPAERVSSPTWGPAHPCKQALRPSMVSQRSVSFKCRPMHVQPPAYACIIA